MVNSEDNNSTVSSIKNLYSMAPIPVFLCNDEVNSIWKN